MLQFLLLWSPLIRRKWPRAGRTGSRSTAVAWLHPGATRHDIPSLPPTSSLGVLMYVTRARFTSPCAEHTHKQTKMEKDRERERERQQLNMHACTLRLGMWDAQRLVVCDPVEPKPSPHKSQTHNPKSKTQTPQPPRPQPQDPKPQTEIQASGLASRSTPPQPGYEQAQEF